MTERKDPFVGGDNFGAFLITVLGALIAFTPTARAERGPLGTIKELQEQLYRLNKEPLLVRRVDRARQLMRRHFDFAAFWERIIIDVAPRLKRDQRQQLATAFQHMLISRVRLALAEGEAADQCPRPRWTMASGAANFTVARAHCAEHGDLELEIFLSRRHPPTVVDLSASGVLLSRQYRGMVNNVMRRFGSTELLRRIQRQAKEFDRRLAQRIADQGK